MRPEPAGTLLLATTNPGKRRELRALLAGLPLSLVLPQERGIVLQVEETGADYAANAALKARAYAQASGLWTLADDTGLEVEVLAGAPGLYSARAAGSDAERREQLLVRLAGHTRPWSACFRCAAALAGPSNTLDLAEGVCPGEIIPEARGQHGFGYDPIFLVAGTSQTMAELTMAQKNELSHRARALTALLPSLRHRLELNAS
jgi:XTP/dITP diphosphohydrolase